MDQDDFYWNKLKEKTKRDDWGDIRISPNGTRDVVLENGVMLARYKYKTFKKKARNHVLTDLEFKNHKMQIHQADGVWMGLGKGRGRLTKAEEILSSSSKKTVRMGWEDGKVDQRVSIFPDLPILEIEYLSIGVNIVDIIVGTEKFEIFGANEWKKNVNPI